MIRKRTLIGAVTAALFLPTAALAAGLNISGSATVASNLIQPKEAQIESAAGVDLNITVNGSSHGLMDLVEGRSAVAMISAPLDEVAAMVNAAKPGMVNGASLRSYPVGESRVAFVVHPSNPVKHLSMDQVTEILSGAITNWSAVGGPDMPIIVVAEAEGGATRHMTETALLGGAHIAGDVRILPQVEQIPGVVKQMPPALGVVFEKAARDSGAVIVETDRVVKQPLFLVTGTSPSAEAERVITAAQAAGS